MARPGVNIGGPTRATGLLLGALDGLGAGAALLFVWGLQTEVPPFWPLMDPAMRRLLLVWIPALPLMVALAGGYRNALRSTTGYQVLTLLEGAVAAALLVAGVSLLWRELIESSPRFQATGWGFAVAGLTIFRVVLDPLRRSLLERGIGRRPALLIGTGEELAGLEASMAGDLRLPYQVAQRIDTRDEPLPAVQDILSRARQRGIDRVLIPHGGEPEPETRSLLDELRRGGLRVVSVAKPGKVRVADTRVHDLLGLPWGMAHRSTRAVNHRIKRLMDLVLTVPAVLVLLPLGSLIALAIKLESPGPVFYKQERLTKGGRRFPMLKFRSMVVDAEHQLSDLRGRSQVDGPIFKIHRDPRVTRVGRLLRRFSLDELPQLLNVLSGDLSLVGPRPPLAAEVEQYEPWQRRRLEAVQGLTGLWQVSGRSDLDFREMVLLDIHYIDHWSIRLDLEILFDTLPTVLMGRGAY